MVTRAGWGAKAPKCSAPAPPITALVVHYSASDADEQNNHANCAARVRAIQNFHMNTRGWCDIAYNFLFCKHGYVFEGRGWEKYSGATGDANAFSLAVCFLGDDTAGKDDVTYDGREALGKWLRAGVKRNPGAAVKGHKDYMSTACPGNELYNWLQTGQWKTIGIPRIRFELWARRKVDGKWKPYKVAHSAAVLPENAPKRATGFITKYSAKIAALAVKNKRPVIRRVKV